MYHAIVRRKVRDVFAAAGRGDCEPMLAGLAPVFGYRFHGEHALGGDRSTVDAMRRWWQRAYRLLPGVRFDVETVLVDGWPWNTTVATLVRVRGTLPDGSAYDNTLMQVLRMRWARITAIESMEDPDVLRRALDVVAAGGNAEAHAEPITD